MLRKIWKDPVISKVLAAAIIALISAIYVEVSPILSSANFANKISLLLVLISCLLFITSGYKLYKKITKSKILVYLSIGGTCRDPIAKIITEETIKQRGINIKLKVEAMAVNYLPALRVSYGAKYAVKSEYGHDLLAKHKCKIISEDTFENADLILVMSQDVLKLLKLRFPKTNDRVYLFKEFFGLEGDVYNPWPDGHDEISLKKYMKCLSEIKQILIPNFDKLINALKS
jgi:protein-tyrosine-phosphatase